MNEMARMVYKDKKLPKTFHLAEISYPLHYPFPSVKTPPKCLQLANMLRE